MSYNPGFKKNKMSNSFLFLSLIACIFLFYLGKFIILEHTAMFSSFFAIYFAILAWLIKYEKKQQPLTSGNFENIFIVTAITLATAIITSVVFVLICQLIGYFK
jgi:hypothetical protein